MGVIFVAGVHGVGKTTICKRVLPSLDIPFYTASDLIRSVNRELLSKDKAVSNIDENQRALLHRLNELDCAGDTDIVLDGHFVLIDGENKFQPIDISFFREMNLVKIIVITDLSCEILRRINERDAVIYEETFVESYQEKEVDCAKNVGGVLDISVVFLKGYDIEGFRKAVVD